jgi:hypothetical protein
MVQKGLQKLSQWFGKGFWNGMMEGKKMESYKKGLRSWSVFLLSKYWLPLLFEEILGAFLSPFLIIFLPLSLSLSLSFLCSVSWGLGGFDDIRGEKSLLQKLRFKWNGMEWLSVNIGGGHIFWNGVMHGNMAKPRSRRWGSCGYIGGGRIFRSGCMHADIFNSQIIFKKSWKLKWTHPLTKLNTNKSCYVDNIWLW